MMRNGCAASGVWKESFKPSFSEKGCFRASRAASSWSGRDNNDALIQLLSLHPQEGQRGQAASFSVHYIIHHSETSRSWKSLFSLRPLQTSFFSLLWLDLIAWFQKARLSDIHVYVWTSILSWPGPIISDLRMCALCAFRGPWLSCDYFSWFWSSIASCWVVFVRGRDSVFALCGFPPAVEGLPQPLSPPSLQPAKLEPR